MKSEINIFEYTDYRKYIHDLYLLKKKNSPNFSYRVFVRICGFSSPNFLKLVIDGKRNLGKTAQEKIIKALTKNKLEKEYFKILILYNQAKTSEEKDKYFSDISRIRHKVKVKTISVDQYEYLSIWHNVAIRELTTLDDFQEDPKWINKKLRTKLSEHIIKKSIELLLKLNLLKRDKNRKLKQTETDIVFSPESFSLAVRNYIIEMGTKGIESVDKTKAENREISGLTVGIDKETFLKIKEEINKCRQKIHLLASESKKKQSIYQVNFQFFNLSEVLWEENN